MSSELVKTQPTNVTAIDAGSFISQALQSGAPVETLERLLAMQKEIAAETARRAYFESLAAFQADCPAIKKTRSVKGKNGNTMYLYASLDDIVLQVSPHLKAHGFSYTIETNQKDGFIIATTKTHHVGGHSEQSSFPVPIDTDGFMNSAQKAGSAQTYAKRYSFANAFGLMTTDQDDDAQSLGGGVDINQIYKKYTALMACVLENYDSIMAIKNAILEGNLSLAQEAYDELSQEDIQTLWVAPTKGGPFTTEERKVMKGDEWFQLRQSTLGDDSNG